MATATMSRRERAEMLVAGAASWPKGTDRATGQTVWYVPSLSVTGKFHAVRTTGCDCMDYKRGHRCMHLLAVDLLRAQVRRTPGYAEKVAYFTAPFRATASLPAVEARERQQRQAARYDAIWGEAA